MSDDDFKKVTDKSVEAKGFVLYADKEWLELKVDFLEGATSEGLYALISSKGIIEGLDDSKIAQLFDEFQNGEPVFKQTIAKGKAPRHGHDGKLEFMIEMEPKKVEVKDDSGNVDFRDLNLIKEIYSGQELLKIINPDPGEEGINVKGEPLTVNSVKKAKFRAGKNVRHDEDSNIVYATADGHVEYIEPLVSVQEEFVVNKDVDFTIGNLKFIGSLIFEASIPNGYTMEAGRDIHAKGVVTGSNLIAKGNITADAGIIGSENTKIECDGILKSKFINEAVATAKGGIECYYEIVRSKIKTLGKLILEGGAIRGGEAYALEGMKVKELGSPLGTPTLVVVGVDYSVDDKLAKLDEAIAQLEDQKGKFNKAIEPFMKNKLLLLKAPEAKKAAVKTILGKIDAIDKKIKAVEQMKTEQETKRYNRSKTVEINGDMMDDVTIHIGNKKKKFDKAGKRKGSYLYDKASFEIVFSRS
jgi:uncharacterized protein (DUF342 family)